MSAERYDAALRKLEALDRAYDPRRAQPSPASLRIREHFHALASSSDQQTAAHFSLVVTALLRRLDELEARITELEARP